MFALKSIRDLMSEPVPSLSIAEVQAIVRAAKAEGVPVVIINGPLVIQQASGGGASNVAFGEKSKD